MEHSETINQIAAAVIAAQGELGTAKKTADNPFFKSKYADLAGVVETARPVLTRHGLGVVQSADCDGELAVVETLLVHTSGEWIKSRTVLKPTKADPQGMGSAVTYARRYAYMAIIGMARGRRRQRCSQPGTVRQARPSPGHTHQRGADGGQEESLLRAGGQAGSGR